MSVGIHILESARQDVRGIFEYIGQDSPDSARRFNFEFKATLKTILQVPEIGRLRQSHHPDLKEIRFFPVKGFDKYLIFYRLVHDGIEIFRVLHSSRDINQILNL
jgi:toxin ParE1/3/4